MTTMNRRTALKAVGMSAASIAALGLRARPAFAQDGDDDLGAYLISYNELYNNPPMLGRVVQGAQRLRVFTAPDRAADSVGNIYAHDVIPIYSAIHGTYYDARALGDVWFETTGGNWVHSAYIHPVRELFQQPVDAAAPFWAEVSIPGSWQFYNPRLDARRYDFDYYRNFYGQVHRVIDRATDAEGRVWYRIEDDIEPNRVAWTMARGLRYIPPEELEPISPEERDKRIVIDLTEQSLTAFERGEIVFKTRVATGTSFESPDGELIDFSTPFGEYGVQRKRPSRRMRGGFDLGLDYDVNGVPWVTYFTYTGAAIHGAYWHNNYGQPRSHGCINVTPDAARWIYRWSAPHVTYDETYYWTAEDEDATLIEII